jgi:hypothetical protein
MALFRLASDNCPDASRRAVRSSGRTLVISCQFYYGIVIINQSILELIGGCSDACAVAACHFVARAGSDGLRDEYNRSSGKPDEYDQSYACRS